MIYFQSIKTETELKKRYKELAKEHHPDRGGDSEAMKVVNAEYDKLLTAVLKDGYISSEDLSDRMTLEKELREKVAQVAGIDDLDIELCGTWLWITGETRQHKDALKALAFRWARKKKAWYFHVGTYRKRGGKTYSLDEIRASHGSISINTKHYRQTKIA